MKISEIKELNERRTQGDWIAVGEWVENANDAINDICNCSLESMGQEHLQTMSQIERNMATANFIAASPAIADKCLELSEALEVAREGLEYYASPPNVRAATLHHVSEMKMWDCTVAKQALAKLPPKEKA